MIKISMWPSLMFINNPELRNWIWVLLNKHKTWTLPPPAHIPFYYYLTEWDSSRFSIQNPNNFFPASETTMRWEEVVSSRRGLEVKNSRLEVLHASLSRRRHTRWPSRTSMACGSSVIWTSRGFASSTLSWWAEARFVIPPSTEIEFSWMYFSHFWTIYLKSNFFAFSIFQSTISICI